MSSINPFRINLFLLAAISLLILAGCASDDSTDAQHAGSSIPWNRPEKWEGPGVMGSMMQGNR